MVKVGAKKFLVVVVILVTVFFIGNFLLSHRDIITQLKHVPVSLAGLLLLIYAVFFAGLALINTATLRLCKIKSSFVETLLLTAYTAVINFFGPLQSGPAFRAIYLKKRYNVNLKDYAAATLAYYFFYAVFSVVFLMSGIFKWWVLILPFIGFSAVWILTKVSPWFRARVTDRWQKFNGRAWAFLAIATLVQVTAMYLIFLTELHSIVPTITMGQALIYTGAANLALFVSITPAAIGFRETFLLFSRSLHHIDASTIVAANLIDRGIYVVVLLIMAAFIFGTHANTWLKKQ